MPLTARVQRAHSDRARDASVKGAWFAAPSHSLTGRGVHVSMTSFSRWFFLLLHGGVGLWRSWERA